MPPQAADRCPGEGPHVPAADLEVIVRRVLADVSAVEPLAVDQPTAAKLLGVSGKTLAQLPAERSGRFHVGRAVRYNLGRLKKLSEELIGTRIETDP